VLLGEGPFGIIASDVTHGDRARAVAISGGETVVRKSLGYTREAAQRLGAQVRLLPPWTDSPPSAAAAAVDRRLVWFLLAVATLVAAALRLPFLGHQSLWLDEIYTRGIISAPSLTSVWHHLQATESTPPLFYVFGWLFGGTSAASMRAIPACALIAAVPVSYFSFRRLIGDRAALAAAAIVAVSPQLVEYSLDARAYGLFVLTALFSVWGFSCLVEQASARRYLGWAIGSALCVWTHYFGVFLVAGEVLLLLVLRSRQRRNVLIWSAVIVALTAPLMPLLLQQSGDERAGFIANSSLTSRLTATVRQFAMGANVPRTWLEAAGLTIAIAGIGAGAVLALRAGPRSRNLLALAIVALGVPLVLAVVGVSDRIYDRNLLFVLPLLAALAAPALLRLRAVPLAAYLVLCAVTSVWVATNWRYEQVDWPTAVARMKALAPGADILVVPQSRWSLVPAQAYIGKGPSTLPVRTRQAWIVVEPYRAAHHRDLGPAPLPTPLAAALAGFATTRSTTVHGFRLILVSSGKARLLDPRQLTGAAVFPPPH
jgi:4-amino-4-deoxy-L-arabinose transferase-like glycosyltransferase